MTGELKASWSRKGRQSAEEIEETEGLASLMPPSHFHPCLSLPMDKPARIMFDPA